jgi:hypothetical protein
MIDIALAQASTWALAKDAIAVARNDPIDRVPHESRDEPQRGYQSPREAKTFVTAQDCIAIRADLWPVDDENADGIGGVETVGTKQRLPYPTLHRREVETLGLVVLEDELRIGRAKDAFRVEQHNLAIGQALGSTDKRCLLQIHSVTVSTCCNPDVKSRSHNISRVDFYSDMGRMSGQRYSTTSLGQVDRASGRARHAIATDRISVAA